MQVNWVCDAGTPRLHDVQGMLVVPALLGIAVSLGSEFEITPSPQRLYTDLLPSL